MKDLYNYLITEASTTSIINKIKTEFKREFGDNVKIRSAKANYTQLYDVDIYKDNIETLKRVNNILKKHLTFWKGFSDEEMQEKIDNQHDFLKRHNEELQRYPIEFCRFTSKDITKMLNKR